MFSCGLRVFISDFQVVMENVDVFVDGLNQGNNESRAKFLVFLDANFI